MSVALYRKYRSKSLNEIVGQQHVTEVLRRALAADKIAHAYLLTGPRGVGKTSIARILAHEINGLEYSDETNHLDIIEIDAASNNGVDDVRELREKALIAPAQAKRKVYIIDEVHMLSKPAFNALLKILEEPPEHIVFVLATTDFDKLPDTIVSRTQRYHFHTIAPAEVTAHLMSIAKNENINITEEALAILANRGSGSLRDSISLLDQMQHTVASDGKSISARDVELALGLATGEELESLMRALEARDAAAVIENIQNIELRGVSAVTLASQLVRSVSERLAKSPQLVHILEGLMETPRSSHPETKLLVTLLSQSVSKPKNVAHQAYAAAPMAVTMPVKQQSRKPTRELKKEDIPSPIITLEPESQSTAPVGPIDLSNFDWTKVLEYTREHHTAFYSILSKCTPEVHDEKLLLYAGRKFNKTKLDSAKYRPLLSEILANTGAGNGIYVEVLDIPAPPKDSQAAKIAAMMGGGEEVDVE